tara:strand:- start:40 stop:324 length:285 start_codon:yes stop_codon:yes gene_type:complete
MSKTLKEVDYLISWGRKEILYDLEKLVSRWKEEIKWMREGYTELDKDTPLCMLMDLQKVMDKFGKLWKTSLDIKYLYQKLSKVIPSNESVSIDG